MSEYIIDLKDIQKTLEPVFGNDTIRVVVYKNMVQIYSQDKIEKNKEEKKQAYAALKGVLAGHEVDLDKMKEERILSKWKF